MEGYLRTGCVSCFTPNAFNMRIHPVISNKYILPELVPGGFIKIVDKQSGFGNRGRKKHRHVRPVELQSTAESRPRFSCLGPESTFAPSRTEKCTIPNALNRQLRSLPCPSLLRQRESTAGALGWQTLPPRSSSFCELPPRAAFPGGIFPDHNCPSNRKTRVWTQVLSIIPLTHGFAWKIPEISNLYVLICTPF